MHPKFSLALTGFGAVLLLAGCESMGTSTAGLTPDEDALAGRSAPTTTETAAQPGTSNGNAVGTALFEQRNPNQLYGASPFPPGPVQTSGDTEASQSYSPDDNLEVLSPSLKSSLSVMRVGSNRNDSNLLSVFAGLKNTSGHSLPLEVETVYKDGSERPLSDGRKGWISLTLKPHEETQYRSIAVSADAADFLVRVRRAADSE